MIAIFYEFYNDAKLTLKLQAMLIVKSRIYNAMLNINFTFDTVIYFIDLLRWMDNNNRPRKVTIWTGTSQGNLESMPNDWIYQTSAFFHNKHNVDPLRPAIWCNIYFPDQSPPSLHMPALNTELFPKRDKK